MRTFNQDNIKEQMEKYLLSKGRNVELAEGYCNGLSSLWGFLKLNGKENLYFEWEDKICTWDGNENLDDFFEMYINILIIFHDPSSIIPSFQQENLVEQSELILDAMGKFQGLQDSNFKISYCFQPDDLKKIIDYIATNHKNQLVKLHGTKHSCSLIVTEEGIEFYDSNLSEKSSQLRKQRNFSHHDSIRNSVRIYKDVDALVKDIQFSFMTAFGLKDNRITLGLDIFALNNQNLNESKLVPLNLIDETHRTYEDINYQGAEGITALMLASRLGHRSIVEQLLKAKADLNLFSDTGRTALIEAASRNQNTIVKILTTHGANINLQDENGDTPIITAASEQYPQTVKLLLKKGAQLSLPNTEGQTALHIAAIDNNTKIFKLLTENATIEELTQKDINGNSVFSYVVMNDNEEMRTLLSNSMEKNHTTPILYALENEDAIVFKKVIENSSQQELDYIDNDGLTILLRAIMNSRDENLDILLERNDINIDFKDLDGNSPITYAIMFEKENCLKKLLSKKANVNTTDINGMTPLMLASTLGRSDVITAILPSVIDLNQTDKLGLSALTYARLNNHEEIIGLLQSKGAVEIPFDFALVLVDALKNDNEDLMNQLFDYFEKERKVKDIDREKLIRFARQDDKGEIEGILKATLEKRKGRSSLKFSQDSNPQAMPEAGTQDDIKPVPVDPKNINRP